MSRIRRMLPLAVLVLLLTGATSAAAASDPPSADPTARRVAALIAALGDEQYVKRERAQQELIKLGDEAFDALTDAQTNDDPEIAAQASYLVRMIRVDWAHGADSRAVQQLLTDYEAQNDEKRLVRIQQLAELPDDLGLEWLCRLVRFEKSSVLAKQAALTIIDEPPAMDAGAWTRRKNIITQAFTRGRRAPVDWLKVYLLAHDDPAGALPAWNEQIEAERRTIEHNPQESQNDILVELLRRKVLLLDRLAQPAEVSPVILEMISLQRGDPLSLVELVDWLRKRQAWEALELVATRFKSTFDIDAVSLYTLCEVRRAQGRDDLAEELAARAVRLGGESEFDHVNIAEALQDRGLTEWSDREYRTIIRLSTIASLSDQSARLYLAESLHDRQRDLEAAQIWQELSDAVKTNRDMLQRVSENLQVPREGVPGMLRAKVAFYQGCDAAQKGDKVNERALIERAFRDDSEDLEVLIAAYHASDGNATWRAEVVKALREAADNYRQNMDDSPAPSELAKNCNQLAWLVANTEGDIDEAVRLSQKSVDLARSQATRRIDSRGIGGYLDTLAHCYFAKRDYASAVKYQTEAHRLDPHAKAIERKLAVFQQALADDQNRKK